MYKKTLRVINFIKINFDSTLNDELGFSNG